MSSVHLVRHGQASFGADDYDRLSELGWKQSRRLGEYWQERGQVFDRVIMGTLRRHDETWQGIAQGLGLKEADWPVQRTPSLNEYDSAAVIATVHPGPLPKPDTPELYRHHFRLLREGLQRWMEGQAQPAGMPSYPISRRVSRRCWPIFVRRGGARCWWCPVAGRSPPRWARCWARRPAPR